MNRTQNLTYHDHFVRHRRVTRVVLRQGPVRACEKAESDDETEKDEEEDNVGPNRANEVHEAQKPHE